MEVKQQYGKTASMKHLNPKFRRKFGYRKSKEEINRMVAKMLGLGITGLGPRMGAGVPVTSRTGKSSRTCARQFK